MPTPKGKNVLNIIMRGKEKIINGACWCAYEREADDLKIII